MEIAATGDLVPQYFFQVSPAFFMTLDPFAAGSITLVLGEKTYRVRKGDSFSYKPSVAHYLKNTGKTQATVIWVCTPPNF